VLLARVVPRNAGATPGQANRYVLLQEIRSAAPLVYAKVRSR